MPLITKVKHAVLNRHISEPFTTADIKHWMKKHEIRQDDGSLYQESSAGSLLPNSSIKNLHSSNNNAKFLECKFNWETNQQEYWLPSYCWDEHNQQMKS